MLIAGQGWKEDLLVGEAVDRATGMSWAGQRQPNEARAFTCGLPLNLLPVEERDIS